MPVYTTAGSGGGSGGSAYRTQWVVFYDITNQEYFLRQYTVNASDAVTATSDFKMDGSTAHTAGASVEPAGNFSISSKVMEDDNQEFIRHTVFNSGSAVSSFDTELDGTTAYVVVGTVLGDPTNTTEVIPRIDDNAGVMTPFWRINYYRNGSLVSSTTVNANGTAYTVTGTERSVTDQYELVDTYYLDVTDAAVVDITDAKADTTGAALGTIPTNVLSAFIDVEITSTDADGLPTGFLFATVDSGATPGSAATPGYKVYNKQKLLLGEAAKGSGDPAEIGNFQVIGDTGETARLVITLLRKRG